MKNGFTKVPNDSIWDNKISDGAFRTYLTIKSYDFGTGKIYPSQKTLSELRGISVRTVITHIKELKNNGIITVKKRGWSKSNLYVLNENKYTSNVKISSPQLSQNLHSNKTKSKKTKNKKISDLDNEIILEAKAKLAEKLSIRDKHEF